VARPEIGFPAPAAGTRQAGLLVGGKAGFRRRGPQPTRGQRHGHRQRPGHADPEMGFFGARLFGSGLLIDRLGCRGTIRRRFFNGPRRIFPQKKKNATTVILAAPNFIDPRGIGGDPFFAAKGHPPSFIRPSKTGRKQGLERFEPDPPGRRKTAYQKGKLQGFSFFDKVPRENVSVIGKSFWTLTRPIFFPRRKGPTGRIFVAFQYFLIGRGGGLRL